MDSGICKPDGGSRGGQSARGHEGALARISALMAEFGLENVGMPYVRPVQGKLWEIRLKGRDGIARSLYVTATAQRVVILRTFVKKTPKTPSAEIALALQRAKEVL